MHGYCSALECNSVTGVTCRRCRCSSDGCASACISSWPAEVARVGQNTEAIRQSHRARRRNACRELRARASIHFHSAMIVVVAAISFRNGRFDVSLSSGLSRRCVHPGTLLGIFPARHLARRPFYSSRVELNVLRLSVAVVRIVEPQDETCRPASRIAKQCEQYLEPNVHRSGSYAECGGSPRVSHHRPSTI